MSEEIQNETIDVTPIIEAKKKVLETVTVELQELDEKLSNLHDLLYGGNPKQIQLDANEAFFLHQQYAYMRAYLSMLDNRIKYTEATIKYLENPDLLKEAQEEHTCECGDECTCETCECETEKSE